MTAISITQQLYTRTAKSLLETKAMIERLIAKKSSPELIRSNEVHVLAIEALLERAVIVPDNLTGEQMIEMAENVSKFMKVYKAQIS